MDYEKKIKPEDFGNEFKYIADRYVVTVVSNKMHSSHVVKRRSE